MVWSVCKNIFKVQFHVKSESYLIFKGLSKWGGGVTLFKNIY